MSAKHTPGPWWVDNKSPGGGNVQSSRGPVADTLRFGNTSSEAVADYANARLIAAAPDMLEALLKIAELDQRSGASLRDRAASEIARAAIAKVIS